jgi:hypothetical protein
MFEEKRDGPGKIGIDHARHSDQELIGEVMAVGHVRSMG